MHTEPLLDEQTAKRIAINLVQRFDPESEPEFDSLWEDLREPEADRMPGVEQASGAEASHDVLVLLIIPLVQALVEKAVDLSVDAAVTWIKQHRGKSQDEENNEIATAVVDAVRTEKEKVKGAASTE